MFDAAINWAKDYGDVLGSVGFLFAMVTVVVTNGKVILQRLKGEAIQSIAPGALTVSARSDVAVIDAPPPTPDYGGKTPIAVLPPKELGAVDDHFAAGLADDLIADLQRSSFATPEISAVAGMVAAGASNTKIARDLGVNHVLSTSIRRQDNQIRVAAQLIDPTGAVLWSDRYDARGDDLMAIQESVAQKVATAVETQLRPTPGLRDPKTGRPYKSRQEALTAISSPKSRLVALMLCIPPLGIFGAHRFYVGRPFTGLLYIPTAGLVVFGWLIDTVLIALGMFADGKGRPLRIWHHDPLKQHDNSNDS